MTDGNKRQTLAKMYRAFLSECVAIMNSWEMCKEININGDCVWGVFETPKKSDVDNVISVAAQLNSMIKILNYKLKKKKYDTISVGIGIDDGRALMVKAGYSGSGINEIVWMGDVVNYSNLNDKHKEILSSYTDGTTTRYEGNISRTSMENWYKENCK